MKQIQEWLGQQRYFYHSQYLRKSGFAIQEPERPDGWQTRGTAESAERKRMVRRRLLPRHLSSQDGCRGAL